MLFDPLDEASALVASTKHPGVFWSLNDSGGEPILYAIDKERQFLARLYVEGAVNTDWESLSMDEDGHLLIIDAGNNQNERRDLCIYRVAEPDQLQPFDVVMTATAERIDFAYPEQLKFPDEEKLNFDSEASFYRPGDENNPGHLYLLTKHRSDTRTVLYEFPELTPNVPVRPQRIDEFDVGGSEFWFGGRVTGAALNALGNRLAVLTYHRIFIFEQLDRPTQFGDPIAVVELNQSVTKQVEAISWLEEMLIVLNEQGDLWQISDSIWRAEEAWFPPHD